MRLTAYQIDWLRDGRHPFRYGAQPCPVRANFGSKCWEMRSSSYCRPREPAKPEICVLVWSPTAFPKILGCGQEPAATTSPSWRASGIDEPLLKKSPSGMNPRGVFPRGNGIAGPFKSCSQLLRNISGNELVGVDDRKTLGLVTALKMKHLVVGAVDMNHLAWI